MNTHRPARTGVAVEWVWAAVAVATAAYFAPPLAVAALALAAAIAIGWLDPAVRVERGLTAALAAAASWPVFFYLRTNVLNQDGNMLTPKLQADVPRIGAHVVHDELLELFVHSRVWDYTHRWWGWSVVFSYQVVSCAAGSLFIFALLRLSRRLAPERSSLFLMGLLSGGYMQLFFGDVENYTITAALVAVYVVLACRFLARDAPLWMPALALAAAICFHLEAGWLLPSAAYLAVVSRSRNRNMREAWTAAGVGAGAIAAVFLYFQFHGLPLIKFFSGHAGHALRSSTVYSFGQPMSYYADQLRLLLLLVPAIGMLVPLAIWIDWPSEETRFLGIAAVSMLIFQAIWKAANGVFDDWNLYSIGAMVISLFLWRYIAAAATSTPKRIVAAGIAAIGWVNTYAWIIANHQHGP